MSCLNREKSTLLQIDVLYLEASWVDPSTEKINRLQMDDYHCTNDINLVATHVQFLGKDLG